MNKKLLLGMALVGSMAFYSCSNYEGQEQDLNEGAEQVITLAVANGNNIATRAGRPLLSSEAGQTIENVVLYIVNAGDNTIVKTLTFDDWQNEADYRTDDGKFKNIVLDEKLPDGNYEVKVSVGKENSSMELSNSTVVVAKFNIGSSRCGTLALIGPVRMEYPKLIPHIEYFAKMLGELLSETMEEQHLN